MNYSVSKLSDVAIFINGFAFKPDDWGASGLPIIRIQNLTESSKPFNYTERKVPEKYLVRNGDVLVSWSATIDVFEWSQGDALLNQHIFKVDFDHSVVDKQFFKTALKKTISDLSKFAHGSTMKHVVKKDFDNHEIPLPPLDDQIRIAHLLGKVEGLIAQRKQQLQQLDDLLKSVFLEMFGGANKGVELTIGAAIKLGYILLHKDGNHGSNYPRKDEFVDLGVPFITAKSIDEFGYLIPSSIEHLNEGKASKLTIGWIEGGDVLLAHNATVGRVGLYRGEFGRALIGTSLTAFRPNMDVLKPIYLRELLRSHFFQRQLFWGMGQATRNQVPITAQRELLIRAPEPSLQEKFAVIFEKIEALKSRYQHSLTDLEALYGALSQQAFKGELDLSRVPLPEVQ